MRRWAGLESRAVGACLGVGALACVAPRGAAPASVEPGAVDAAAAGADEAGPAAPAGTAAKVASGQLLTRYRGRFTGDADDHDLYETVDVALADPGRRWTASVSARAFLDLDGEDGPTFFGLADTYDHRLQAQLTHAYVDVASESFSLLRLGRQPLYETPVTALLDGLRAELLPRGAARARAGAYAGVGEHPYESSPEGDFVLGAFGATRAWEGAELRADWMHLEDARLGVDHEDDLLGLALGQDFPGEQSFARLDARFTSLEGDGRDLRVTASRVDERSRTSVQASFYRLLKTQKSLAAPLDPFSDSLFELFPYDQLGLSATKDWRCFGLLSGADLRRVQDADDAGTYNRDFERYYLTGTLSEVLPVTLALTGELWDATDTDLETWGASLSRAFDGGWSVSAGSHYALYEYDLFTSEERDHVRIYTLDLRWEHVPGRRWALRYELERNDFDDFHQVRLDHAWSF
jgi:hypothetical protein